MLKKLHWLFIMLMILFFISFVCSYFYLIIIEEARDGFWPFVWLIVSSIGMYLFGCLTYDSKQEKKKEE